MIVITENLYCIRPAVVVEGHAVGTFRDGKGVGRVVAGEGQIHVAEVKLDWMGG